VDYVYTCRSGDNEELRYSIRSVIKNLPPGKIWIVGEKPSWYSGGYVRVLQNKNRYSNVQESLNAIASSDQISENFVLMNDDFFAISPRDEVGVFHGGLLKDKIDKHLDLSPGSTYTKMLQKTYLRLLRMGVEAPLDYELHVPMVMNKKGLDRALKTKVLWRSAFGNLFKVGGEQIDDVKVYASGPLKSNSLDINSPRHEYISSNDDSFEIIKEKILKDFFVEKSPYEL
jgi:hypothetical protein